MTAKSMFPAFGLASRKASATEHSIKNNLLSVADKMVLFTFFPSFSEKSRRQTTGSVLKEDWSVMKLREKATNGNHRLVT